MKKSWSDSFVRATGTFKGALVGRVTKELLTHNHQAKAKLWDAPQLQNYQTERDPILQFLARAQSNQQGWVLEHDSSSSQLKMLHFYLFCDVTVRLWWEPCNHTDQVDGLVFKKVFIVQEVNSVCSDDDLRRCVRLYICNYKNKCWDFKVRLKEITEESYTDLNVSQIWDNLACCAFNFK